MPHDSASSRVPCRHYDHSSCSLHQHFSRLAAYLWLKIPKNPLHSVLPSPRTWTLYRSLPPAESSTWVRPTVGLHPSMQGKLSFADSRVPNTNSLLEVHFSITLTCIASQLMAETAFARSASPSPDSYHPHCHLPLRPTFSLHV